MPQSETTIFTIGHSNHPLERFLELLRGARIAAVVDVRSRPYSRHWPQFSRPALEKSLASGGIDYAFLGVELGGKRDDPALLDNGRIDFDRVAATPSFRSGLDRVVGKAGRRRLALLCAEREPLDCHRFLLVGRHLHERGMALRHILADGRIEDHDTTVSRLLARAGLGRDDLLAGLPPPPDLLALAYRFRGGRTRARHGS
jgi:uncharacterized protein (DUF488 family)